MECSSAGQFSTETATGRASFSIARFRFTAIADTEIQFSAYQAPAYKGSTFHGGFGHALKHVSPAFYRYFYPPPGAGDPPKPFVVMPPLDEKSSYAPSERFQFELGLFGTATQHFPICFGALGWCRACVFALMRFRLVSGLRICINGVLEIMQ